VFENDDGVEPRLFFDLLKNDVQEEGPRTELSELFRSDSGLGGGTSSVLLSSINCEMLEVPRT
jgi:hypothetical protein